MLVIQEMSRFDPKILLIVAAVLLFGGVIFPLLMVIKVLESTMFLNFMSFIMSTAGTVIGLIGAMILGVRNRNKRDK